MLSSWTDYQYWQFEKHIMQHMLLAGYEVTDVPVIDESEIFLTRAGDKIIDRLLTFTRSGREYALRPEFTAIAARKYVTEQHQRIARWQFRGAIFEDDPQTEVIPNAKPFYRHGLGAELLNATGVMAESEIIHLALEGLNSFGFKNLQLVMGHVGIQQHLLTHYLPDHRLVRILLNHRESIRLADNPAEAISVIHQLLQGQVSASQFSYPIAVFDGKEEHPDSARTQEDIIRRLQHNRKSAQGQIEQAVTWLWQWSRLRGDVKSIMREIETLLVNSPGQQMLSDWQQTLKLLSAYGIPESSIELQPDLTRNWEYYTGIVFGIRIADTYVAAGGRYDELVRLVGGAHTPAVGFAYYVDRLAMYQPDVLAFEGDSPISIIQYDKNTESQAIQIALRLRQKGLAVILAGPGEENAHDDTSVIELMSDHALWQGHRYLLTSEELAQLFEDVRTNIR